VHSVSEHFVLSEKSGFNAGHEEIRKVFTIQRNRFVTLLESLPPSSWDARSRCSEWSVHQVAMHVRDVARIHVARLGREPYPFEKFGKFDPRSSPSQWLSASAGESPSETLRDLAGLVEREESVLHSFARSADDRPRQGPLRRPLHWSVSSLHIMWDAWMHEQDIILPLGRDEVRSGDEEMRLVSMYSLLAAAAPAALSGDYLETCLGLGGAPDEAYRITHHDDDVRVVTGGEPELRGPAHTVIDSLTGRGPEPQAVLEGSVVVAARLAQLRAVAT
jgi:uncharacterized protein (TIGR03083 family)